MKGAANWAALVPAAWDVHPLKRLASIRNSNVDKKKYDGNFPVRLCNYVDVYYNEQITDDLPFMEATATDIEKARFTLRAGDVIITKDSESWDDIAVPAHVPHDLLGVVCGYHLTLLRPNEALQGSFLLRCLQAIGIREQFWLAANGVTRFGLTQRGIKEALIPVPPRETQHTIANFLDRKTAAIDELIAKKERLIKLLQEKRQALITQAVTKGLDPNVPMKDSGIEWLGEIPAHWGVMPVRRLINGIEQGWSPRANERPADEDEWAVLKLGAVFRGRFRPEQQKALAAETEPQRRYEVQQGDLLITRANTLSLVGDTCVVEETRPRLMLPDLIYRISVKEEHVESWYLSFFLLSDSGRSQIVMDARGSSMSMAKVSGSHIRSWIVPLPPIAEQQSIVMTVRVQSAHIDSAVERVEAQIAKLREYRQALITAAVTGQLDVAENIADAATVEIAQ